MAHVDEDYALAIGRGIRTADRELIYVANVGSEMAKAGERLGLEVVYESYVDGVYDENGQMASRDREDALIRDPQRAAEQVLRFIDEKAIVSTSGKKIPCEIHMFCVDGDEPTAVPVMQAVRAALAAAGIAVVPLPVLLG